MCSWSCLSITRRSRYGSMVGKHREEAIFQITLELFNGTKNRQQLPIVFPVTYLTIRQLFENPNIMVELMAAPKTVLKASVPKAKTVFGFRKKAVVTSVNPALLLPTSCSFQRQTFKKFFSGANMSIVFGI